MYSLRYLKGRYIIVANDDLKTVNEFGVIVGASKDINEICELQLNNEIRSKHEKENNTHHNERVE